jgi:hypothetical protein
VCRSMNLHNTVRAEGMSDDVEPLRVAIEEMEKVHPRGLVQPLQVEFPKNSGHINKGVNYY